MIKIKHTTILFLCLLWFCFPSEAESVAKKDSKTATNQGYQSIQEAKFLEVFNKYLYNRLGKERSDVVVSKLKIVGNRPVPTGNVSFQLFQKNMRRLEGYVRLIAVVYVNGVVKNKVKLSGWVDVFEFVVCTSRNLKRGEIIKKEDAYFVRRNISRISPNILTDMSKVIGLMAKHNIKTDTCLKEWMLEKSPIVDRGDMVTILAKSGDLKITVPGRVLMKGYMGEFIKVQNSMSKKEIYAKVVNSSTVMVDF